MEDAINVQVGGDHYKKLPYQPIQLAAKINLNGFQLFIIKYVTRYHNKAGKMDLEKAIHTAQLGVELNPKNFAFFPDSQGAMEGVIEEVDLFCKTNKLPELISEIVKDTIDQKWISIVYKVELLIKQEYPNGKD